MNIATCTGYMFVAKMIWVRTSNEGLCDTKWARLVYNSVYNCSIGACHFAKPIFPLRGASSRYCTAIIVVNSSIQLVLLAYYLLSYLHQCIKALVCVQLDMWLNWFMTKFLSGFTSMFLSPVATMLAAYYQDSIKPMKQVREQVAFVNSGNPTWWQW